MGHDPRCADVLADLQACTVVVEVQRLGHRKEFDIAHADIALGQPLLERGDQFPGNQREAKVDLSVFGRQQGRIDEHANAVTSRIGRQVDQSERIDVHDGNLVQCQVQFDCPFR